MVSKSRNEIFDGLPPRLIAETALAEAELIALRLPRVAIPLLHLTFNSAVTAGDPILAGRAAILLVLATARSGDDVRLVSAQHRDAIRTLSADETDWSGWPARRELAQSLLEATPWSPAPRTASPELDPREVRRNPAVGATAAPTTPPGKDRPGFRPAANLGVLSQEPSGYPPAQVVSPPISGPVLNETATRPLSLPAAPVRGSIVRRWHDYRRRRKYAQHTVAFDPNSPYEPYPRCHLTTTTFEVLVEREASSTTLLRSRRRYLVIPLLGSQPGNAGESYQQSFTDQIPMPASMRPLFVHFRDSHLPLSWQLWDPPPGRGDQIGAEYRGPPSLRSFDSRMATDSGGRWRAILHLVGSPVPTAAGWRLRVVIGSSSSSEGYVKASRSTYRGEELLSPDNLAVDRTALVALQAEPVDQLPQPLGEQFEGMYAFAAELRDAGAGAVLVVPPLPETMAVAAALRIRVALTENRHQTHPVHVLDLVDYLRNIIASAEEPSHGMPRAARDVLLLG